MFAKLMLLQPVPAQAWVLSALQRGGLGLHVQSSLLLYAPWGLPALIEINTVDPPDGLAHIGLVYGNTWKVK